MLYFLFYALLTAGLALSVYAIADAVRDAR